MRLLLTFIVLMLINLAHASNFHIEIKYINTGTNFTKLCKDQCPNINYWLIASNDEWLASTINKRVVAVFAGAGEENSTQDLAYKEFVKIEHPSDKQFVDFLKQSELFLINEHKKLIGQHGHQGMPLIDVSSRPDYLGHRGELELFSISDIYQMGGAGTGTVTYYVFDLKNQKQLTLDDVLMPNQKSALEDLVKTQYLQALTLAKVDIAKHQEQWPFYLSENFTFNKYGLKLQYQSGQITPERLGMPEFTIKYSDLKDILRPEYL